MQSTFHQFSRFWHGKLDHQAMNSFTPKPVAATYQSASKLVRPASPFPEARAFSPQKLTPIRYTVAGLKTFRHRHVSAA